MRLTTLTDYAIRLLMYAGNHPDRLCTIAEVAQVYGISEAHLMKVTHLLGQQGWITTVRGKGGGMRLAHAPAQINLGAVVRGVEPDFALVECFATGNNQCTLTGDCRLTGVLGGALRLLCCTWTASHWPTCCRAVVARCPPCCVTNRVPPTSTIFDRSF